MTRQNAHRLDVPLIVLLTGAASFAAAAPRACATVILHLESDAATVDVGETLTISILATIEEDEAIVGWGLDLAISSGALGFGAGDVLVSPLFVSPDPLPGDGDGLLGLVLPPGQPVYGRRVELATIQLTAVHLGSASLSLTTTPGDPLEGFVMPGGGVIDYITTPLELTVVPGPSSLVALAGLGASAVRRRRRTYD